MNLQATLVELWNDMVDSEMGSPPSEVAEWADFHIHRFTAFIEIARKSRARDQINSAVEIVTALRRIFTHHHAQDELATSLLSMTGRRREQVFDRIATMRSKNERVRKPLDWLHTKIVSSEAAAHKFA